MMANAKRLQQALEQDRCIREICQAEVQNSEPVMVSEA